MKRSFFPGMAVWLGPVLILGLITVIVWRCTGTVNTVIASSGIQRDLTSSLREQLIAIRAERGDELLVATVISDVELRLSDTARERLTGIPLGTSEASVKAPVTFRYMIRLSDAWHLRQGADAVIIQAPEVRAVLPPAVDTAGMVSSSANGWARFNAESLRDQAVRALTAEAATRAAAAVHIDAARDKARIAVAEFARAWILKAVPGHTPLIVIKFPGEKMPDVANARDSFLSGER